MKLKADSRVSLPSDSSGTNVVLGTVDPDSVVSIVGLATVEPDSVVSLVASSVVEFEVDGSPVFSIIQSSKYGTEEKQCGFPESHEVPTV